MKNNAKGKRRDRKTGVSPYVKYDKAPTQYSGEYYAWKSKVTGKARRKEDRE